jgi:hypothetical protein
MDFFEELAEKWPSSIVSRSEIKKFSGGMISGKYMANLDSQGLGPDKIKCGGRIGYPVKPLIQWMRDRSAR